MADCLRPSAPPADPPVAISESRRRPDGGEDRKRSNSRLKARNGFLISMLWWRQNNTEDQNSTFSGRLFGTLPSVCHRTLPLERTPI